MLKSFAFMPQEVSAEFFYEVYQELQKLKWYFVKFARGNYEEAMEQTLMHTLTHFNKNGNLSAYIKKLAREITKDGGRVVPVDFLENTVADEDDSEPSDSNFNTGKVSDFASDIVAKMDAERDRRPEVVCLALEFMDKFLVLCNALLNHDTTTVYYPEPFIKSCLKLSSQCQNFNDICMDIFMEFGEDFEWFINLDEETDGLWKETDCLLISQSQSKRILFLNSETEEEVVDADTESWFLHGNLGKGSNKKKIVRVDYEDVWEKMCDLIDAYETNEMKFIIDDNYIVRTLGGSISIINPDTYNLYDLVRMEILTNLLKEVNGRVLNVGSRCMYFLCSASYEPSEIHRVVKGIPIDLVIEDVTSEVESYGTV